jgi:phage shock protein A
MITMTGLVFIILAAIILIILFNKRIRNLLSGKVDRAIDQQEKGDPDAIYRSAIKKLQSDILEIRDLSTEATGMVFQVQQDLNSKKDTIEVLKTDLQLAVTAGDKQTGSELIERIEHLEEDIKDLEERQNDYQSNADETIKSRQDMEKELQDLKDEYAQSKTLGKADAMMQRIRDRKAGLASDEVSTALMNARAKTAEINARRKADKTTGEASLESRIAKLRAGANTSAAGDKFDALVAKK